MDNFALRRTDAARFLAPRWVGSACWNREPKGCRLPSWLNAICAGKRRCSESPFPNVAYRPPALYYGETDRSRSDP